MIRCVGREVKIESVPPRVARAALQLDETGVNGSSFHAQTGRIRQDERGLGLVQIPPRALIESSVTPSQRLLLRPVRCDFALLPAGRRRWASR
jgi:hypothetical protein